MFSGAAGAEHRHPASHAPLLGLVFNIMFTLFSWPAGHLSDRISRRGIAAAGYVIFAAVYFMFGFAPSHLAIWIAMATYGLFYALTNPVLKALVVDCVSADIRGRALGVFAFVTSVAMLLASLLTGELWKHFGPRVPFYFSAGIAAVAAVMLMASRRRKTGKFLASFGCASLAEGKSGHKPDEYRLSAHGIDRPRFCNRDGPHHCMAGAPATNNQLQRSKLAQLK